MGFAAYFNTRAVVEQLAKTEDINAVVPSGPNDDLPIVMAAVFNVDQSVVSVLIAAGADINAVGTSGMSALHVAVALDRRDVAAALIAAGANVNKVDANGITPLCIAAHKGRKELFAALVAAGASVEADLNKVASELTLTDARDAVVARRVLLAADYLPAGSDLSAFPANAETSVRLWLDAKGLGAAGYRLYVFYP